MQPRYQEVLDLGLEGLVGVPRPVVLLLLLRTLAGCRRDDEPGGVRGRFRADAGQQDVVAAVAAVPAPVGCGQVAGLLGEFTQLLRVDAVGGPVLGAPGPDGFQAGAALQPAQGAHGLLDACVGHVAQPQPVGAGGEQLPQGRGAEAVGGPVVLGAVGCRGGGVREGLRDVQDHLVAEHRHLVEVACALGPYLHPADPAGAGRPGVEEGRVERQLLLLAHTLLDALPQLRPGGGVRGAVRLDGRVEGVEQREAPYVADDDPSAVADPRQCLVQDADQVVHVGEVLDDGVDDDGVDRLQGEAADGVGLAPVQDDRVLEVRAVVEAAADGGEGGGGEVRAVVPPAFPGEREEQ